MSNKKFLVSIIAVMSIGSMDAKGKKSFGRILRGGRGGEGAIGAFAAWGQEICLKAFPFMSKAFVCHYSKKLQLQYLKNIFH